MPLTRTIQCRFYGALNRFLKPAQQHRNFFYPVKGIPAIKDTLEALGVPHTEIDCIVVNGRCVRFSCQIHGGECVRVYSNADKVKLHKVIRLKPKLPLKPKFVLDVHLGKLARNLRLLGFDTFYENEMEDAAIVRLGHRFGRIVLTRDIALLKHKSIRRGYFVRATDPQKQIREVVRQFALAGTMHPFRLCLVCNGRIRKVAKSRIIHRLPPLTKKYYEEFYHCPNCDKIYWQGSHYDRLSRLIKAVRK